MSVWIIAAICLLPLLFFTRITKKLREKFPDTFNYVFSLAGTFIGVFVGLYITGIQANNDRKDLAVKVLEAGKKEMKWLIDRSDKLLNASDTLSFRQMEQLQELELPSFFSSTLHTELMADMLDPYTIEEFNHIREDMFFDIEVSKNETAKGQRTDFKNDLKNYRQYLTAAVSVMNEETARLNGEVKNDAYEKNASRKLDSFSVSD